MSDCLKHPRGRGRLEEDSQVGRDCYVSRDSIVRGSAVVRDGAVLEGQCVVEGESVVLSGYYRDTYIGPGPGGGKSPFVAGGNYEGCFISNGVHIAGNPNVLRSVLACKRISGRPVLTDARLYERAEVFDSPTLEGVTLKGSAWVYQDSVLQGAFTVGGMSRVERGFWGNAPRTVDFGYVSVTEAKGGALVDCRFRTFADWKRNGERIARRRAFVTGQLSVELVRDVLATIAEWEQGVSV